MAVEVLRLGMDTRGLEAGSMRATRSLGALRGSSITATRALGMLGVTIGAGVLLRGFTNATSAAMEFESSLVRLNTLVGISEEQTAEWSGQIRRLSTELGVSAQEMSRAMFAITSGGARGAEALEILEQSAKASAVGLGDMTAVGRLATAAVQAFGAQGLGASEAIDVMMATVREGNLEAEALAGSLGRVMGAAATMGATFQDVGAFVATFTRLGVSAEMATTALQASLNMAIRPTSQARDAMAEAGFSVEQFRAAIQDDGLALALIQLVEAAEGNIDTIGQFVPNVRALAGVLGTAGVQAEGFVRTSEDINEALGITNEAFERWGEEGAASLGRIKAAFEVLRLEVGDRALPVVASAMDGMVDRLRLLTAETETWAQRSAAILAALNFRYPVTARALEQVAEAQERVRLATDPGPTRADRLGEFLAGVQEDVARERERQAGAAQETARAEEEVARAAEEAWRAMIKQSDVLGAALDLDIQRRGLMVESLSLAAQLRTVFEDQNRALEDRVEAAQKFRSLQGDILGNLDRQLRPALQMADVVDGWQAGFRDLPDAMNEPLEMINQFAREAEESAFRFEDEWLAAISVVGASLGGLASQVANIVTAFARGGPVAGIAAGIGAVIGLSRSRERDREQQRLAREAERAADALSRMTAALRDLTALEQERARITDAATEAVATAIAATRAQPGLADMADEFIQRAAEMAREGMTAVDILNALEREFRTLHDQTRAALLPVLDELVEAFALIEAQRQREIQAMQDDIAVRMLVAQGRDAEAEILRMQLRHLSEVEAARALEDEALLRQLELLHDVEMARLLEEQAIRATEDAIWGVTRALNAPAGLNLAIHRMRSMLEAPSTPFTDHRSTVGPPPIDTDFRDNIMAGGTTTVHQGSRDIHIEEVHVHAYPGMDGEALIRDVERAANRRASMGDPLDVGVEVR